MAVFYTQPKIHKSLTKPPGRPIVSGIESLTVNISTFVDFFLRPIVEKIPSYVKDSGDLIKTLDQLPPLRMMSS